MPAGTTRDTAGPEPSVTGQEAEGEVLGIHREGGQTWEQVAQRGHGGPVLEVIKTWTHP